MKVELYNLENKSVGQAELPEAVFGIAWKPTLVQQVLTAQLANRRRPWAHAKTRAEVRGGGRKPWRQKGTGRARHGSIRSPLWSGGGKAHGPLKDRDYTQKVNVDMKRLALFSVLSRKLHDGEVRIFDSLALAEPKTKMIAPKLRTIVNPPKHVRNLDVLLIPDMENKFLVRAARNLPKTKVVGPGSLNVHDILSYKHLFIDQKAVATILEHYSRGKVIKST